MMSNVILVNLVRIFLMWLPLSFGIRKMLQKLETNRRWMAWVPGLRYAALGKPIENEKEGVICGILEVVCFLLGSLNPGEMSGRTGSAFSLAFLALYLILFIYRIRMCFRIIRVFGLRKRWIWLWLIAEWLTVLILGSSQKYQPQKVRFSEEWEAGTAPAKIKEVDAIAHTRPLSTSGLSIDLKERTVRNFSKKRYLLKDIALDIPNGSMVLLLGGSGSGKTTLVNAVIGYEKADATVLLNGYDVYKDYDRMKYRIGFVPQQNLIRGNDTVIRTVSDSAKLRMPTENSYRDRKNKVAEVLDFLGLGAGSDGLVSKKSGGQLRRISIAMELVSDPELFVLDEPDSGLDGVIAREIFTKLRGIADEGKIVIVITHTPDRVIDLFDKVIVLGRDSGRVGRLAFYGSPQEAREFFGKETMEGIVMSVNRKEQGGDGLADEFIARYAQREAAAAQEVGA